MFIVKTIKYFIAIFLFLLVAVPLNLLGSLIVGVLMAVGTFVEMNNLFATSILERMTVIEEAYLLRKKIEKVIKRNTIDVE